MSSLRNEAAAARQLLQELAAAQAEPLDDETADIAVDSETGLKEAISRAVMQMREAEAHAKAISAVRDQLSERSERLLRRAQRIKDSIAMAMNFAGMAKATLPEATLSLSNRKPGLIVEDGEALPERFIEIFEWKKIKRDELLKALKAGETVPGATLDNGGQTLTIRTK